MNQDQLILAAIVSSTDDAIIGKNLHGTITSWNPAAERIFGYNAQEAIGESLGLIVPANLQHEETDVLRRIRAGERIEHYETLRRTRDGALVELSLSVSPINAPDGTIVGASEIARDITRTRRLEHDARHFAAIVASSDDAIVAKDLDSIVTSWNAAAERMFGYAAAEIIGRSVRLIIPGDRQYEEDDVLKRIRAGRPIEHFETVRRRKDGTLVPVSLTISPIRSERGVVIGASKIARDITARIRADEERLRLLDSARSANRLKDEFLATLSHELRTPLNAIVGYSRMLQGGMLTGGDKQAAALDTLVRNAASLTQIVEDVLDVSRIVSGKLRMNVQPVELSRIVREAAETSQAAADAKGIRLDVIADPQGTQVTGDPDRLRQVLWNLCSNAVKFSERGARVEVRLERVNSQVEVTVADTGIGIPPEFLPHLFERFSQADAGASRLQGGLGLGLAISRHLVELHGGRISAHSEGPGRGSTFRIELPVRGVGVHSSEEPRAHEAAIGRPAPLRVPRLDGTRILVVDDDRDAQALSREILELTGATVITADSGQDALDKLVHGSADMLIADIGMPRMDGFELIARIRASEEAAVRDIPAAALTAFARSEDRIRAMRSGFEVHLSKPIEPDALLAAAATLARRKR
jgi:PAS domain S-box-containing protein